MECLGIEIDRVGLPSVRIYNVYRPPEDGKDLKMDPLAMNERTIICGDLNTRHPSWCPSRVANQAGTKLHAWLSSNAATVWNEPTTPTRDASNTSPDVTIAAGLPHTILNWRTEEAWGADHRTLMFDIPRGYRHRKETPRAGIAWGRADWKKFTEHLENTCAASPEDETTDPHELAATLTGHIRDAIREHIPKSTGKLPPRPWWDKTLTPLSRSKDAAFRSFQQQKTEHAKTAYEEARARFAEAALHAKTIYWGGIVDKVNRGTDLGLLFRTVREIDGKKTSSTLPPLRSGERTTTDPAEKATLLAKYYANVCKKKTEPTPTTKPATPSDERQETTNKTQHNTEVCKKKTGSTPTTEPATPSGKRQETANNEAEGPITLAEIERAVEKLKAKASTDPEGLCPQVYKAMEKGTLQALLKVINASWDNATIPKPWKEAHAIPLPKPGKDKSEPAGYRPISLTSVAAKIMETVIRERLDFIIEGDSYPHVRPFTECQGGFRKGRGTEEQLFKTVTTVDRSLRDECHTCLLVFDLAKAFDTVDHDRLIAIMKRRGIPPKIVRWVEAFLQDRKAKFRVEGKYGEEVTLESGVPQGTVLGPVLFLLYIDDLGEKLSTMPKPTRTNPNSVTPSLFADDVGVVVAGRSAAGFKETVQRVVNALSTWASEAKMDLAYKKTEAVQFRPIDKSGNRPANMRRRVHPPLITFPNSHQKVTEAPTEFGRKAHEQDGALRYIDPSSPHNKKRIVSIGGVPTTTQPQWRRNIHRIGETAQNPIEFTVVSDLQWKDKVTLLGLTIDDRLNFTAHIDRILQSAGRRVNLVQLVSGTKWGHKTEVLRALYMAYALPVLTYGMAVYIRYASKKDVDRIECLHRTALCAVVGCKKTTLTEAVLTEARMLPIRSITDLRTGALAEKMATKTMWKDVLHPRRTNDTLPQSFLILKKTARTSKPRREKHAPNPFPPWKPPPELHICASLPKKSKSAEENRRKAEAVLDGLPSPTYIVWTDGSVAALKRRHAQYQLLHGTTVTTDEVTRWGGAGLVVYYRREESWRDATPMKGTRLSRQAGKWATSYRAEQVAMKIALESLELKLGKREVLEGEPTSRHIWVLSDSSSLLNVLSQGPHKQQERDNVRIWQALEKLVAKGYTPVLQFVYGHCGLAGNEEADGLAKQGVSQTGEETQPPMTVGTAKARYREHAWEALHAASMRESPYQPGGPLPYTQLVRGRKVPKTAHLTRRAEREIRQLRTGHHQLLRNCYRDDWMDLAAEERQATRPCQLCDATPICPLTHLFLECRIGGDERATMWRRVHKAIPDTPREKPTPRERHKLLWPLLFELPEAALAYLQAVGLVPKYEVYEDPPEPGTPELDGNMAAAATNGVDNTFDLEGSSSEDAEGWA
ncbi:RNA-directed DNA polymerase from mobile element jockey [Diplonema papillatum]|nr:RNA-directed DNA polymerase from mobile element jockey [Diplonema papillatum]KAJ9435935.1 RNA-directed DNA polymerase from mobile element jockey [Diplonema papillatum]KAJ9436132.1 RNA-directed DNA polymerase from mobile element jockey [Diplonema papillatum]KAJ9437771.1 RNA-directed DNA polymerase from mobile element jockey [Diplonema papillatum]KAJ9437917.1 RNA-directed DNA polymerase from mobile element jockey [Diplonema papillatum]